MFEKVRVYRKDATSESFAAFNLLRESAEFNAYLNACQGDEVQIHPLISTGKGSYNYKHDLFIGDVIQELPKGYVEGETLARTYYLHHGGLANPDGVVIQHGVLLLDWNKIVHPVSVLSNIDFHVIGVATSPSDFTTNFPKEWVVEKKSFYVQDTFTKRMKNE